MKHPFHNNWFKYLILNAIIVLFLFNTTLVAAPGDTECDICDNSPTSLGFTNNAAGIAQCHDFYQCYEVPVNGNMGWLVSVGLLLFLRKKYKLS